MAMGSVRIPEEGNGTVRPLRVDPSRCSRMRYSGSRCERCVSACPRFAIRLDECLDVREERCTGCLTCTTVCPTGALSIQRPEMAVTFDATKCSACELCCPVCPARAMEVRLNRSAV